MILLVQRCKNAVVPYSAGGSVDVIARVLAQKLGERLHQSVVVDNTTGAGGGSACAGSCRRHRMATPW
ncbi:protein of unknown function [Cupriavidus neocaledonicus]|uniref:Uncharacterized protein n=1 Tax=Cupriavidus neocaledonicus TaxID=1040979 RepID=A0A375H4U6_9BURK|nr:protein of unknown function [Cupriavidus neocaledonicus]